MSNQSDSYILFAANPAHQFFQCYTYDTKEEVAAAISAIQSYHSLYFPKDKTIIDHVNNHTYLICMEA